MANPRALLWLALGLLRLGHTHPTTGDKDIVGGTYANIEDYPYTGAILLNNKFHCGGTLLSRTRLLSAAHCFDGGAELSSYQIRFGSDAQDAGGTLVGISDAHINPDWNPNTIQNDIAVIDLASPAPSHLRPAKLPEYLPSFGSEVTLVGWGRLYTDGPGPIYLRKVNVDVLEDSDCYSAYKYPGFTAKNLCLGVPGGGKGSCFGDSGGPAIQDNDTVVGVTSYGGPQCASAHYPSVYVNVKDYLHFINRYL